MIEQLFQIEFLHGYFSGGRMKNCRLAPDAATARLIDRYRLAPLMEDGVFSLHTMFQDGAAALAEYLQSQLEAGVLRFFVVCDEKQFFLITDLPLDWCGQVVFSSASAAPGAGGTLALASALAESSGGGEGAVAVVSIRLGDLLAMGGKNVRYVAQFPVRAVHWLYYMVNRSDITLRNPAVVGKNGSRFDGPETVVLASGESALSFKSGAERFPLQQAPVTMFDLVDRLGPAQQAEMHESEHCLIKGLPTPRPDQLNITRTALSSYVFCAMHVYL